MESWLHYGNMASDVQDLIVDDPWGWELEVHPVTKDLYSKTIESNHLGITDKVNDEEFSPSYG